MRPLLQTLECQLGKQLRHHFLYMPDFPIPLLGQDLLCKLNASPIFSPKEKELYLQVPPEHALCLQFSLITEEQKNEDPSEKNGTKFIR